VALTRGDLESAGRVWGAVVAEGETYGTRGIDDELRRLGAPLLAETDPRFGEWVRDGAAGSLDDALTLALGSPQTEP
jgi:hypothetical protein